MTLPDRLQALRARSGLSYAALARKAGTERAHVFKVCSGVIPTPTLAAVERIVAAMGYTMADLYAVTEEPTTPLQERA